MGPCTLVQYEIIAIIPLTAVIDQMHQVCLGVAKNLFEDTYDFGMSNDSRKKCARAAKNCERLNIVTLNDAYWAFINVPVTPYV